MHSILVLELMLLHPIALSSFCRYGTTERVSNLRRLVINNVLFIIDKISFSSQQRSSFETSDQCSYQLLKNVA